MIWDSRLKQRLNGKRTIKVAEQRNERRLKLRVMPPSHDKSADRLSKLEAENAELRRRAAELALEIHALRDR